MLPKQQSHATGGRIHVLLLLWWVYRSLRIPRLGEKAVCLVLHSTILETLQPAEKLQSIWSIRDENFTHQVLAASRLYF